MTNRVVVQTSRRSICYVVIIANVKFDETVTSREQNVFMLSIGLP